MTEYPAYLEGLLIGYGYLQEEIAIRETFDRRLELVKHTGEIEVPWNECLRNLLWTVDRMQPGTILIDTGNPIVFSGWKRTCNGRLMEVDSLNVVIRKILIESSFGGSKKGIVQLESTTQGHLLPQSGGSLCSRCPYFIPHPFNTCNAFHPEVNVSECADFPVP